MGDLPKIFVINLDIAQERLAFMCAQSEKTGVSFERVAGVKGIELPEGLRDQFLDSDGNPQSSLSAGEIGCYASHLEVARQIVARNLVAAVILEDDVALCEGFADILQQIMNSLPDSWDIVKLCNYPDRSVYSVGRIGNAHLVRFYRQPVLAAGYLLSNAGARKLLLPRPRVRPIDIEMRQPWHMGLDIYGVCPPPVTQIRTIQSYIKGESDFRPARRYGKHRFRTFQYAVKNMGFLPALACRIIDVIFGKPTSPPRGRGAWVPYPRDRRAQICQNSALPSAS